RFVPEKGLWDLISAYSKIENPEFKLVISGDADHETNYSRNLKKLAQQTRGVLLTGILKGLPLQELYSNTGLFVIPSYYEGLPIALLEALSYGVPVLVSDIPQHKEIPLPEYRYFRTGNVEHLKQKIVELYKRGIKEEERSYITEYLKQNYSWDYIAKKVLEVYKEITNVKTSS
ncbi:MAG: glycosyltransferase, partial [Endomicrobia bacterium]|nr:glycosyltransferase [Endomicrobiia bacterium]